MPKISDVEVARRIRENPASSAVGIMMISAKSKGRFEAGIYDLDRLDVADYISKPFSPDDLVQRINDVINREKRDS